MKRRIVKCLLMCSVLGMFGLTACGSLVEDSLEESRMEEEENEEEEVLQPVRDASAEPAPIEAIEAVEMSELSPESIVAYEDYAIELWKRSAAEEENFMVSPASVMFAMDMVALGAKGETLSEITEVFSPGQTIEESLTFAHSWMEDINGSEGVDFSVANSVWIEEELLGDEVKDDYLANAEEFFDATATVLPFDLDAIGQINDWVDENTNGMIPEIMRDFPSEDTVMVLINAIAFEGEWAEQYEEHQIDEGEFQNADGSESTVEMLSSTESTYFETEDAVGVMKYYEGYEYAFLAILPEEGMSADEYVEQMTGESYREFWESRTTEYDVQTQIPCFSYEYGVDMTGILQDMGVETAFDSLTADLTGIAEGPEIQLYLSQVLHKTFIELDENGTRAAAVTVITVDNCAAVMPVERKEVILDRPFVYAIVDAENGLPVFIGTVNVL